jgi:hypothetical protein
MRPSRTLSIACVLGAFVSVALASVARAEETAAPGAAPGWRVTARSYPTNLPPGGHGVIRIDVYNIGAAPSSGTVTVTDTLPPGVSATEAGGSEFDRVVHERWHCKGTAVVKCTNIAGELPAIDPGDSEGAIGVQSIAIAVDVPGGSPTAPNQVTISGGGAASPASVSEPLSVSSAPAGFGFAGFSGWFSNGNGTIDTQAGSHPYELTVPLDFNTVAPEEEPEPAGGEARTIAVNLPPGLIGDPEATPRCRQQFDARRCPADTQIGFDTANIADTEADPLPVYNLVPPSGLPAQFGFTLAGISTFLDASVRSGGDYGITEHADNVAQREIPFNSITIWGVPAEPSHDALRRAPNCLEGCESDAAPAPFLTLPTSCTPEAQPFTIAADTWQDEALQATDRFELPGESGLPTGFTGCERLALHPSLTLEPETTESDTATGLQAEVKVPQEGLLSTEGLASADIQNTTVTLPEGVVVNPGQAAGLAACQAGAGPGADDLPREGENGEEERFAGPPECPPTSKIGTVTIETPLLADKLEGAIYVLQSNPPNLQILVAASADGVNVKLIGDVHLNEQTGRITTTFSDAPQLPFTDFKLTFDGGARAALDTPTQCGAYETTSDFTPWGSPFVADAFPSSAFAITGGPAGAPCPASPLPLSPSLAAGTASTQAGGFTSFSMQLARGDGQQRISSLRLQLPQGLLGMVAKVPLCGEPQAQLGTCPASSQIGHAVVQSGPGSDPLELPQPGDPEIPIYLTGPTLLEGPDQSVAPYGLSIVTPVLAGPFDLGTVVTRAKIEVNPTTAQITVTSDPLPQILDGVPTDLRTIDAVIDRPEFIFNPTDCEPQSFAGTVTGVQGATAEVSSPFGIGGCRELAFAPKLSASTSGHTSKALGASLTVKIAYPSGGGEANLHKVDVELPKALPTQLKTLNKACTEAQFNADPAGCPPASDIAHVVVHTPVLASPLAGPVYLVSHGGAAFPDVEMVLQGEGVELIVDGHTQIKQGITYSHFETIPDAPFSSFEFVAPQGEYALFTAHGNLCDQKLTMPTTMTGQNGAVLEQNTPVEVEGCPGAIAITSHKIKGRTITLSVVVPAAGRLTASGRGLSRTSKSSAGRETLTLKLHKSRAREPRARVKLSFIPKQGQELQQSMTVTQSNPTRRS